MMIFLNREHGMNYMFHHRIPHAVLKDCKTLEHPIAVVHMHSQCVAYTGIVVECGAGLFILVE